MCFIEVIHLFFIFETQENFLCFFIKFDCKMSWFNKKSIPFNWQQLERPLTIIMCPCFSSTSRNPSTSRNVKVLISSFIQLLLFDRNSFWNWKLIASRNFFNQLSFYLDSMNGLPWHTSDKLIRRGTIFFKTNSVQLLSQMKHTFFSFFIWQICFLSFLQKMKLEKLKNNEMNTYFRIMDTIALWLYIFGKHSLPKNMLLSHFYFFLLKIWSHLKQKFLK